MSEHHYLPRDYAHFARLYFRHRRRQKAWGRRFEAAIKDGSMTLPAPAVVQIIPTEACNLRCPMCNQWGESGYFLAGARKVSNMPEAELAKLVAQLSPQDSMINLHGGEPFAYRHIDSLLELLAHRRFDLLITTNGTLMKLHVDALASVRRLVLLLSVDGDRDSHDRVRGPGTFQQICESLVRLFDLRRRLQLPLPLVIMSTVVCEWTTDVIEKAWTVARDLRVFILNFNLRYFMPESAGLAYEKHLAEKFGVKSSGAWRGWIAPLHEQCDYRAAADRLRRLLRRTRFRLTPPYAVVGPSQLRGNDFDAYFTDYANTFGNESCFMPFYWARVHANGDLIYCPGHPDIIAGNVFRGGLMDAFNSEVSIKFRRHMLTNRMPICNRCCGLYMTNPARPAEQKARRRAGLPKEVTVHWP